MPNTVAIGDIMGGRPGKALPPELEEFVAGADDGVMVVSFGSYIDFATEVTVRKLCDAFTDRRNRLRVVWKMNNSTVCGADHIDRLLMMPWIPQNDLLADARVQIFVSHGGFNSIIESVYHAKPLLIFPICADQPFNAAAAESKGFAIRMDVGKFTADTLLSSIETLLTNATYKENVHLASAILRDRRDTPAQRVSAMIDHVIKYGDRHLRTGAFELNVAQFFMLDIFAVLLAACVVAVGVTIALCHCICRACRCSKKN